MDFVVIDTEGNRELREVAIINSDGELIYEAFNQEHPRYQQRLLQSKPLKTILQEILVITRDKLLIFHHAKHDLQVLNYSFRKANLTWSDYSKIQYRCTVKLAQQYLPSCSSYSLEHLARKLNLKVDQQYFIAQQAHVARYDAQFTYQLYIFIQRLMIPTDTLINPFGSSRVDNPFQVHPDNSDIYHTQYKILESVIADIKYDSNHQSKGVVIIGDPGTGKTHLIMRLAKQRLTLNRILFVPCPNDAQTIKYHTYSCVLESLNRKIPDTDFSQLDNFLANTFLGIIQTVKQPNQRIENIINSIKDNPLKLYEILGGEGTQTRRDNWDLIERVTTQWWINKYGAVGYAPEIIKGIVKFCRYSDVNYKQLVKKWLAADELEPEELSKIGLTSWHDEISKEDFSLEAIAVFGRLSLLNEPLIIVFDQLEMLGLPHNRNILLNFGEAVKEIFTRIPHSLIILNLFPDRWQQLQDIFDGSIIDRISQYQIVLEQPTNEEIKAILQLKAAAVATDLTSLFTPQEIEQIINNKRSIRAVLNNAAEYFRYKYHHIPLPKQAVTDSNVDSELVLSRLTNLENQQNKLVKLLENLAQAFNSFTQETAPEITETIPIPTTSNGLVAPDFTPKSLKERIITYLETQQKILEQEYNEAEILIDERDAGKLKDILEAFNNITKLEIDILPSKRVLPPHVIITNKNICIGFLSACKGSRFTSRIQNYNEFVATKSKLKFILWRDERSDPLNSKTVGYQAIVKLNNTNNGEFKLWERGDRLTFELIYRLISDLYNQDFEIDKITELQPALEIIASYFAEYWLVKAIMSP
ncbi:exonuclease RNase T and DNA polymerase III [Chondrocystis sp. NIES-4102]|nr:exonuclease RNase T and DNA polymerase III [Chondrocystis sp. NIES-4102]